MKGEKLISIITPEELKPMQEGSMRLPENVKSVFLAGTIDNGNSLNWQDKTIIELINLGVKNLEIYNPRREHWNLNPSKEEMENQIKWEQDHLDKADIIAMVLLDDSKSPISLLEMGLYATSGKLMVFCTSSFYRWDNVRLTCEKYNIELIQDINPLIIANKIISKL
jgi:hypothetical protein